LLWANTAAILDEAFQEPVIGFASSIGSDHTGLWVTFQHILDSTIEHNPCCTSYLINDEARDTWICHLMEHSCYVPFNLFSTDQIDQAANLLTQEIEEMCQAIFKECKQPSLRTAVWWDKNCDRAAALVQEAPTLDAWKQTHKALIKEVQAVKHHWANEFLHNATTENLWATAKWCLGCRQSVTVRSWC
jgi:hypothetical protein